MNARLRDLETGEDKLLYQGEEVTSGPDCGKSQ